MVNKTSFVHHVVLYVAETKKADKHVYVHIFAAWLLLSLRFFNVFHSIELECDFSMHTINVHLNINELSQMKIPYDICYPNNLTDDLHLLSNHNRRFSRKIL